jgi:hypothetical protein
LINRFSRDHTHTGLARFILQNQRPEQLPVPAFDFSQPEVWVAARKFLVTGLAFPASYAAL